MYAASAYLGVALCLIGFVCAIIGLIMYLVPNPPTGWGVWIIVACICYGFALLWGNVGVLFTHAGLTG